ncbi:hypothetical protein I7I48_01353 [Histoplasma ohiense]|nr:hypothetical protein I7I48_01353 [Histoplasma ohiense (nom. inval.)]
MRNLQKPKNLLPKSPQPNLPPPALLLIPAPPRWPQPPTSTISTLVRRRIGSPFSLYGSCLCFIPFLP